MFGRLKLQSKIRFKGAHSSLSRVNEYMAINNGGNMSEKSLRDVKFLSEWTGLPGGEV